MYDVSTGDPQWEPPVLTAMYNFKLLLDFRICPCCYGHCCGKQPFCASRDCTPYLMKCLQELVTLF